MADHRRTKRLERLGADFNRTGYMQFYVRHISVLNRLFSQFVKFFTSDRLLAREVFPEKQPAYAAKGLDSVQHEHRQKCATAFWTAAALCRFQIKHGKVRSSGLLNQLPNLILASLASHPSAL
jgi:hypothetical protein